MWLSKTGFTINMKNLYIINGLRVRYRETYAKCMLCYDNEALLMV